MVSGVLNSLYLFSIGLEIIPSSRKTFLGFRKQCERFDVSIGHKHVAVSRS